MSEPVEHTLTLGKIAIDQIRLRGMAAVPKNYEIWYTYAAGSNTALNERINSTVQENGFITQEEMDQIYDVYLSPLRMADKLDAVGGRLVGEVDTVMSVIEEAAHRTASYSINLNHARDALSQAGPDAVRRIVEDMVRVTSQTENDNRQLEERLNAARREIAQLQENLEAVRAESLTDPLTSLGNRKYYDASIERLLAESRRTGRPLSLLVCDIDHFKRFNDTFGHLTGDQVLRLVAQAIKHNIKGQDIACRYGGEEFVIILPDTNAISGTTVADHVRRAVMAKELVKRSTGENLGRITISIGVSQADPSDTIQSLYERADHCLYAAKRNGRNMVVAENDAIATKDAGQAAVA